MKNNTFKIAVIFIVLILAVLFFNLNKKDENEIVKIGVILPLTGIAADYGKDAQSGIQSVAFDNIEFIYEDDACDAKTAVSAFNKLVTYDKVHVIIGPGCGSPQEAVVPLLEDNDVVMFTPAAASRDLYTRSSGNFFNMQYSLEDEAKFLAEKIFENGFHSVALIAYKNAFSETHARAFKEHYKGVVAEEISFVTNDTDVSTELIKIKDKKIDAIVAPDISFFFAHGLSELEKFSISTPVYSSYVAELPAARPFMRGVYYSFPGDLNNDKGATYILSQQAAMIVGSAVAVCGNNTQCIKTELYKSGDFDANGVFRRPIVLKQIVD